MIWSSGYSAAYYMAVVDPNTWQDIGRIEITGGSISRSRTDLMESADIDCVSYPERLEQWVRVYLDTRQNETSEHTALFTGLACSPSLEINGNMRSHPVECYSVLKPAQDVLLQRGWYAPAGANGAELVKALLEVTPAPVEAEEGAPALSQSVIAEDGENNLSMAVKILDAMGWRLRISGAGTIRICPPASDASAVFSALGNDSIELSVTVEQDWYKCPNVFRAVQSDVYAVARDDSEESFLSTVNRGREVWMEETGCSLNSGESLEEYAIRRLREEQSRAVKVSYDRRYDPAVYVGDLVQLHYPRQGIEGVYTVDTQTVELSHGAKVSESIVR